MLYSLDTSLKQFVEFFEAEFGDNYTAQLRALDSQLQQTMADHNFTDMLQLYKAVAIK